ncbi:MAG: FAD-dependent oxidoreductase [Candidatus Omnitrophota bacterium]|nr:FAD-dependent oxidoreductase [Candidatus Omnitrophota bacterium]
MSQSNNIIIGAGISGLSCAYALKDCLVLEKEHEIGGLCRTIEYKGFRFDLGGHRLFSPNQKIENTFKELLKGEIIEFKRKSKIWKNQKFIDYPLQTSVIFNIAPWHTALSLLTYLYRKISPLKGNSFKDKATNRFGDNLYKLFLKEYTEKVWGLDCSDISEDLVYTRLQNVSLKRVIKFMFKRDSITRSFSETIIYPKKGIFQIIERISNNLNIELNNDVTKLVYSKNRIEKVIVNNNKDLNCRSLVSTMPITKLINLFDPPDDVKKAAENLRYRSVIFVFLILKKEAFTENHWIYIPDGQIFGRIHEPKNWSAYMAPKEKTGICLEIFCDVKDKIWNTNDNEIAYQAIRDIPLEKKFEIEDYCVKKVEYAYPVYDIDYKSKIDKVKKYLSAYKNLFLLGRTGSFRYINMDICLEKGLELGYLLKKVFKHESTRDRTF